MSNVFFTALLLLGSIGCTYCQGNLQPNAPIEAIVVPFLYDPPMTPVPIVYVRINGSEPQPFVFDTGFNASVVIDTVVAEHMKLHGAFPGMAVSGGLPLRQANVESINIVGTANRAYPLPGVKTAYITDLAGFRRVLGRPRIAGIIGLAALPWDTVRFDFAAGTISLTAAIAPPRRSPGVAVLPLKQRNAAYYVTLMPREGVSADLLVDTGSTTTSLPLSVAAHLRSPATTLTDMWLSADMTLHISDKFSVPALQIGALQERDIVLEAVQEADAPALGIDLLSRYLATLDLHNGFLILERGADYAKRSRPVGRTGIRLAGTLGRYSVEAIEPGSPADGAHLHVGDRITAVDEESLNALSIAVAQHLLDGFVGERARLRVTRKDGSSLNVACMRESMFANAHRSNLGLTMEKATNSPLVVLQVDSGSLAEKQGLRAGDVIVTWNGHSIAPMTAEQLRAHVRTPGARLTVRRKGFPMPIAITLAPQ